MNATSELRGGVGTFGFFMLGFGAIIGVGWITVLGALVAAGWVPDTGWRVLHTAALYGVCGAAAGLLLWLGWGLPAFSASPWFVIGTSYGMLLWAGAALPALVLLSLRLPALRVAELVLAVESLAAALAVGLLCAFVWHRAA